MQKNILNISFLSVINLHKETLYAPNSDLCVLERYKNVHIYSFLYILIVFVVSGLYIVATIKFVFKKLSFIRSIKKYILLFLFFSFFLLAILQQYSRYHIVNNDLGIAKKRSEHEKKLALFKAEYAFATKAINATSGWHQADFLTDLNCNKDPCIVNHRIIKFFLYPTISLDNVNQAKKDAKVLFFLDDPQKVITNKDKILVNMDNKYILTIEE